MKLKKSGRHARMAQCRKTPKQTSKGKTSKAAIPDDVPLQNPRKSGPTKESNPRSEIVATILERGAKRTVHVVSLNKKRDGAKFDEIAKKLADIYLTTQSASGKQGPTQVNTSPHAGAGASGLNTAGCAPPTA